MFSTVLLAGVVEHFDPSGKLKDKKTAILNDTLVCHFGRLFLNMLVPAQTFCSCLNCNGKKQALEPEERTWNGIGCWQIKTAAPCPSPISEIWGDFSLQ